MAEVTEKSKAILNRGKQTLIASYARLDVVMERGEGCWVWDADGKRYLDLFAGFGGCVLGHCHPALVAAVTAQAKKLWHVGNTFYTEPQIELAERLVKRAFDGRAFFCHGGADANEAACKLARLRGSKSATPKWKIISLHKSFHGRTLAMIAATGNPAVRSGFAPDVPGFVQVEPGNFRELEETVDHETAGILMEPIQGEGGINVYPPDYAAKVRELCDKRGITLIFDEVWTGCGRTGHWFGHQHFTDAHGRVVEPDIMTLGKAIGGGLPVGVMFAKPAVAELMIPGKHGSTLGGNPICMAAARTVFDVIEKENLVAHAASLGERAMARLRGEAQIADKIAEVRGRGLFLGIELKEAPHRLVERGLEQGIVVNVTAQKVIRLAPPINISPALWEQGLDTVVKLIAEG